MPDIKTPGQALLTLIEYYQDYNLDPEKLDKLNRVYISGASDSERSIELYDFLLNEEIMQDTDLTLNEKNINDEPERRYFETHLAYNTLAANLKYLDIKELEKLFFNIFNLLQNHIKNLIACTNEMAIKTIDEVIDGKCLNPKFNKTNNREFNAYIQRLINGSIFQNFSLKNRIKVLWIVRILYAVQLSGWANSDMPLNIYNTHALYVNKGKKQQSKEELISRGFVRNQNFGLLKGHMLTMGINDIAFSETPLSHVKPCDYFDFDDETTASYKLFQHLVHPFSNGISGLFLMLHRCFAKLHKENIKNIYTESLENFSLFIKTAISSILYYGGGHSIYEFTLLLSIPEVIETMQFIQGFATLNLEKLFYDTNRDAFDTAISNTIQYKNMLTLRKELHTEIITKHSIFKTRTSPSTVTDLRLDTNNITPTSKSSY